MAPRSSTARGCTSSGVFLGGVDLARSHSTKNQAPTCWVVKESETMRFLGLVRSAEGQGAPPPALMQAMGLFIEASLKDGSLVQTGGLAPGAAAVRIRQAGGRLSVMDGPFAETKELVGGYAILEAPSHDAAVEIMRKFMQLHEQYWPAWQGECE